MKKLARVQKRGKIDGKVFFRFFFNEKLQLLRL